MAVREFDGIDDVITVDNGAVATLASVAHSFVMLVKPTTLPASAECYMAAKSGGVTVAGLYGDGGSVLAWADDDDYSTAGGLSLSAGDWQILGFNHAAGAGTPRFHRRLLGAGAMTHGPGGTSTTGVATATATFTFGANAAAEFRDMRLAAAAVYTASLSDADFESITSSTAQMYALGPVALWDFNQASTGTSVLDLTAGAANQTAITGTTVITTDDPSGWTFGLTAAVTPVMPPSFQAIPFMGGH